MKKLFKKSIACLIAVLMVFSTMPLSAFAAAAMDVTENVVNGNNYSLLARYGTVDYFCEVLNVYADGNWVASKGNKIVVPEGTKKIEFKFSAGTYQDQTYDATYIANLTNGACYYGSSGDNYSISTDKAWKMTVDGTSASVSGFGESALTGSDKALYKNGNGRSFDTTFTYTNDSGMTAGTKNAVWQYKVQLFNRTGWTLWKYTGVKAETNAELLSVNFEIEVQHNYQTDSSSAQAATCTTAGKHADLVCSVCGDRITGATINALGHNYQADNITYQAPTCTTAGKEADQFCTRCDDIIKGATINALGHDMQVVDGTAKDATCTVAGKEADKKCSRCDYKETGAEISATGHSYTTAVTAPTCTEQGYTTYTCSEGDHEYKDNYTDALGHDMQVVDGTAKDATCTEAGKEADKKCSRCNYTEPGATIDAKGHIEEVIPAVEATCTTAGSTAGTKCSVCDVIIVAPETIPAKGHSYNYTYNDDDTHTKACENCDESTSEPCTNALKKEGTTSDTWHCTVCGHEYQRAVSEKGTLIAAIDALKNDVNADDAEYRYTSEAINKANGVIESAQLVLNDRYADQKTVVDAMVSKVASEKTDLNSNGLAKYTVTFEVVNDDNGETVARDVNPDVTYGTVLDFNENLLVDKDGNSLVVYKWKKRDANNNDTVLNSTSKDFSVVVKENATYFCYVLNSKASDETNTKTRVRYIDKSGKTIKIDFATVGDSYTVDNNVKAPKIPYYKFTEWNLIYGDDVSVGTRELVYQAQYEYDEVEANNCTIIGLNGVYVNGSNQCTSRYDDKVMLTGADETDKYAFCDSTGNTIISYINNDYIHTPHLNGTVVYITKVKVPTTDATTAVTGYFTQPGTPFNTLYVNAQYYLPEGATTVEAGIVISRLQTTTDTLQIGNAGVAKVESNSQGSNHEYSIGMTYSASATYYSRSYLIYKLADGTTKTVYSNDVTIINV